MSKETSATEWLSFAQRDRETAKYLLDGKKYPDCAYHCQQAIEKLLKAIVVLQTNKRPPHTHGLLRLSQLITGMEIDEPTKQAISAIDSYYTASRYPIDSVDISLFDEDRAKSAVEKVDQVFVWFSARINFGKE